MPGYYDYAPQIELRRPVIVIGYLSHFTRGATYRTAALLGLPYHDVERAVEHEAGMEISRIVLEHGEARYRELESRALERSLEQRPAGLIALGDGGLLDEKNRARVGKGARLVVFDFELPNLLWRVQQHARQVEQGSWHPLYQGAPATVAEIRPYYQERRSGFEQANARIPASSLSVPGASEALRSLLERSRA